MTKEFQIIKLKGEEILPYIPDLAALRIKIFKDYPYLYEGDRVYEARYLQAYTKSPESMMVCVFYKNAIVGASTAIPLEFETSECQKPFIDNGWDVKEIFYLGESVLLPEYRGNNLYRRFFAEREAAAAKYGCKTTAFCAVERDPQDPRRPKNYEPLDKVWQHFGYKKHPELCAYYEWKEIGEKTMSPKPLIFWLKKL